MSNKGTLLQACVALDSHYTRAGTYREMCPGMRSPDREQTREYYGYMVDKVLDSLCQAALKEVREKAIDFILECTKQTAPTSRTCPEARIEQLHSHNAIQLVVCKEEIEKLFKARFQFFNVKMGQLDFIYKTNLVGE